MDTKIIIGAGAALLMLIICVCLLCSSSVGAYYILQPTTTTPETTITPTTTAATAETKIQPSNTVPEFASVDKTTTANDTGNTYFLDRQNIDCGNSSVLNHMVLTRPNEAKIQYNYKCLSANDLGAQIPKETPLNDEGGGALIYLDRHDVRCDNTQGISGMTLVRDGAGKYKYVYKCVPVPKLGNCVEKKTPVNDIDGYSAIYLDRHNIKCDDKQVLNRIHLVNAGNNKVYYEYSCCSR